AADRRAFEKRVRCKGVQVAHLLLHVAPAVSKERSKDSGAMDRGFRGGVRSATALGRTELRSRAPHLRRPAPHHPSVLELPWVRAQSSTNFFNRPRAASHCFEITSRYRRASSRRWGSSCQTLSRPYLAACTRPAFCITRKCFVIAWRVMSPPAVSLVMDI